MKTKLFLTLCIFLVFVSGCDYINQFREEDLTGWYEYGYAFAPFDVQNLYEDLNKHCNCFYLKSINKPNCLTITNYQKEAVYNNTCNESVEITVMCLRGLQ